MPDSYLMSKLYLILGIFCKEKQECLTCRHGYYFHLCIYLLGHCGDQDVEGRIILRWIFRKFEGTGWSWLRIGTGGWHLWVR
jgi:hypothetical protein